MPGNFFSKPHGLHPTPSACFPPKSKPKCTGEAFFLMSLRDIPIFAGTTITGCAEDLTRPHAEPVDVEWDFPLLNGVKPATIPNGIPTHFQLLAGFLAGPAVGTCKFTWLNGCKLLRSMEYTVESPPPP